jgi:tetratricopeptide (TPR) repeat protein
MKQEETSNQKLAAQVGERMSSFLAKALKRADTDSADGALARGTILSLGGFHEQAAQSLTQALTMDSGAEEAAARLVLVQIRANELAAALETAVRLTSTAPRYAMEEITTGERINSFSLLGLALLANGRQREAVDAFKAAEEANPADGIAWAYLALLAPKAAAGRHGASASKKPHSNPRFASLNSLLHAQGGGNPVSAATVRAMTRRDLIAVPGRPLVVGEGLQFAAIEESAAWCEPAADCD